MLYQKGTQRIEVIVRKDGGGGSAGANETPSDEIPEKKTTWRTALFGTENRKKVRRAIITNATHLVAVSKQTLGIGMEYIVSGIGFKTGDQAYQDSVSRQVEIFKDTSNVASSVSMGMVYGAWGGPLGSLLGATFGAISTGVSVASKYRSRERDYDYKIFKEQNAIEYNRARAGINLTNGRLR